MYTQPTFCTARLELRPACAGDDILLHGLWSDPLVKRFLFDDRVVSLDLARSVLADFLSCAPQGQGLWLVYEMNGSRPVGCVGLSRTTIVAQYESALRGLLEPVAALAPAHWGKGYAREALRPLLNHAFETLNQPALAAANDLPNLASERMLLHVGFVPFSEVQGPVYRLRTYRLDRETWRLSLQQRPRDVVLHTPGIAS